MAKSISFFPKLLEDLISENIDKGKAFLEELNHSTNPAQIVAVKKLLLCANTSMPVAQKTYHTTLLDFVSALYKMNDGHYSEARQLFNTVQRYAKGDLQDLASSFEANCKLTYEMIISSQVAQRAIEIREKAESDASLNTELTGEANVEEFGHNDH